MSLDDQLRHAGDRLHAELESVPVPDVPRRRSQPWRAVAVTAALTVFIGGSALWFVRGSDREPESTDEPAPTTTQAAPPEDTVFGTELPWVLLFDDGIDGVLAIDLNNRIGSRSVIEGQYAGDAPYRLELTNQRLIVGSGEIYSTDPTTRQSTLLGEATIYLPAAEPARVWLIDYPSGRIQGTPTAWQVSAVTGAQLTEPTPIDIEGIPAAGIRGGLAIETDNGIALWDAATATVTAVLGTGPAFVADASPDVDSRLAWCQDACTDLHITNLESGEDLIVGHPNGTSSFDARSARFSNDRRFLAAPAGADVIIVDLDTETATVGFSIENGAEPFLFVSWAPSGPDLFASTYSYGQESTTIVHHRALNGETTTATLPFGGTLSFVVVNSNQGAAFLQNEPQGPQDCPPVYVQPSGRVGICGFHF